MYETQWHVCEKRCTCCIIVRGCWQSRILSNACVSGHVVDRMNAPGTRSDRSTGTNPVHPATAAAAGQSHHHDHTHRRFSVTHTAAGAATLPRHFASFGACQAQVCVRRARPVVVVLPFLRESFQSSITSLDASASRLPLQRQSHHISIRPPLSLPSTEDGTAKISSTHGNAARRNERPRRQLTRAAS